MVYNQKEYSRKYYLEHRDKPYYNQKYINKFYFKLEINGQTHIFKKKKDVLKLIQRITKEEMENIDQKKTHF